MNGLPWVVRDSQIVAPFGASLVDLECDTLRAKCQYSTRRLSTCRLSARQHVSPSVSLGLSASATFTYLHLPSLTFTYSHLLSRLTLPCSKPTSALPWSSQTSASSGPSTLIFALDPFHSLSLARSPIFPIFLSLAFALRVHDGPHTPPRQRQRRRGAKQSYMDFRRAICKCAHPVSSRPIVLLLLLLTARSQRRRPERQKTVRARAAQ